jgi:hypothetical protein
LCQHVVDALPEEQCSVVGVREELKVVHVGEESGTAPPGVSQKALESASVGRRGRWRRG